MVYKNSRRRRSNRRHNPNRRRSYKTKRFTLKNTKKNMPSYLVNYGPGNTICPDRYFTKLKYFYGAAYTSANPSTSLDYTFRANGVFDPDFQFGGQQPTGLDQIAQLYAGFVVMASKCKMTVHNRNQYGLVCGVVPTTTSTTIAAGSNANNYKLLATLPYNRTKICGAETGNNKVVITNYMSTSKILGVRPQAVIDSRDYYGVPTSSDPAILWFWHNAIMPLDPVQALDFEYALELTFYVAFDDRIRLPYSV